MRDVRCPRCKKPEIKLVEKVVVYDVYEVEGIGDDGELILGVCDTGEGGGTEGNYVECHNCYVTWDSDEKFKKDLPPDKSMRAINIAQGQMNIYGERVK